MNMYINLALVFIVLVVHTLVVVVITRKGLKSNKLLSEMNATELRQERLKLEKELKELLK